MVEEKLSGSFHASLLLRRSDLARMTGVELIVQTSCMARLKNSTTIHRRGRRCHTSLGVFRRSIASTAFQGVLLDARTWSGKTQAEGRRESPRSPSSRDIAVIGKIKT